MAGATILYDGEITEAWAQPRNGWRRRRAAMLLVGLDQSPRSLRLAPRTDIEAELARAGLPGGGAIQVLWSKRFSVYLCHAPDGRLAALRFAARGRTWLAPAGAETGMARLQLGGPDERTYAVNLRPPGETLQLVLEASDPGRGFAFAASFLAVRRRLTPWLRLKAVTSGFGGFATRLAEALTAGQALQAPLPERRLAA